MAQDSTRKVLALVRKLGVLRPRDLRAAGLRREYVQRLLARGELERIGRGLYAVPEAKVSAYRSLAEVSKVVPQGVVCLLSALRYHGLTAQHPSDIWLALPSKAWRPRRTPFPVRAVYFSTAAHRAGIETRTIDGVAVRIYSPAKTVADCFKYRNKIGIDVALEALRNCRARRKCNDDDLRRYAKICRVANVMRPYLEATSRFAMVAVGERTGRYSTTTLSRAEGQAFKARWAMVGTAERDELRATSMDKKLRQLAALMASVAKLGWKEALAAEEFQAREQWRRLRQAYGI